MTHLYNLNRQFLTFTPHQWYVVIDLGWWNFCVPTRIRHQERPLKSKKSNSETQRSSLTLRVGNPRRPLGASTVKSCTLFTSRLVTLTVLLNFYPCVYSYAAFTGKLSCIVLSSADNSYRVSGRPAKNLGQSLITSICPKFKFAAVCFLHDHWLLFIFQLHSSAVITTTARATYDVVYF